jgi:hypothetical protein
LAKIDNGFSETKNTHAFKGYVVPTSVPGKPGKARIPTHQVDPQIALILLSCGHV